MSGYTMRQARDIINDIVQNPVENEYEVPYLEGDPGLGKTAMAKAVFQRHQRSDENPNGFTHFIAYVAPEREPTDWGLPMPNQARDAISMLPLDEFKFKEGDRPFIFLDEIDKANNMMQNVLGRVMHEQSVGNIVFPDGTFVMAAGNKLTNRAGGMTANTHIKNRRCHIPVMVDAKEWVEDVAIPYDLHPAVISFIRTAPDMLHKFDPNSPSFPSPRSVTKVGRLLNNNMQTHVERARIEGHAGVEWANTFWGHLKIFRNLRNPETIIANPDKVDVPSGKDMVAVMYAEVTSLAKYATKGNADAIFRYFNRLTGEYGFVGYRDVLQRDKSLLTGSKAAQQWLTKNATMLQNTKA